MATAYVNGQVIDGRGKAFKGYVIVDGDKIAEVGNGSPPSLGESVARQDLTSKSILPGLIDCHVHLRSDGLADPRAQQASDTDAVALLRSARNARRTLECGVTTIRDCGSRGGIDFALRTASQQGLCPTPRLVLSGLIVCMTGGHGWQLGYEADGPDAVRRAARTQIKLGADNVKLIASGGIVVVDGNPIDDVAVLRVQDKIRRVVLNGQTVLDRDASRYLVGAGFSSARSSSTARR
jgi:imidazolonepropionase-like amidohydrolase